MPSRAWWLLLLLLLAGCSVSGGEASATQDAKSGRVTGTVTYRERIALPPDAVVEVQLLDVSLMDVAATLIAEQTIKPQHQVPIAFELPYDPADIDERLSYAVRATIRIGGKAMFITNRSYPVLTRGTPNHVDLVLVRDGG
jgi:putative lipoprotein